MSEFVINSDMFGNYAVIPTDYSKAMHTYKVVSVIESNYYCDTPITVNSKEILHDSIEKVLLVIHCGIDESKVIRVALKDCKIVKPAADVVDVRHGYWIDGKCGHYKICSECNQIADFYFDYCPNCGAKMDGKDGE